MIYRKRKTNLLKIAKSYHLDGYIVPSHDAWQGESIRTCDKRLKWLTGFSGSNGVAMITNSLSYLYTDSRYLLQAKREVESEYKILNMYEKSSCTLQKCKDKRIGYDPILFTVKTAEYYKKWAKENNIILQPIEQNLVDEIWDDRPIVISSKPYFIPSVMSSYTKLNQMFSTGQTNYTLLCRPESICWLLNIRASDLQTTPILLSYLILNNEEKKGELFFTMQDAILQNYIVKNKQNNKLNHDKRSDNQHNEQLKSFLEQCDNLNIQCFSIGTFIDRLQTIRELIDIKNRVNIEINQQEQSVIASDFNFLPSSFFDLFTDSIFINQTDPCIAKAAIKTKEELENIQKAHIEDGIALTNFLIWLSEQSEDSVDETQAANKLREFRQQRQSFQEESFKTISAYGENGAVVHYHPSKETNKIIGKNNLYLVDSGGQHLYGTTDVTRTICLGLPTQEQKNHFTYVLKGHILLANTKFPIGTSGANLDVLARYYLWQNGLNYGHGTGHGVGYFLSVHEGPQGISSKNNVALEAGMIISIEPGLYIEKEYGIRIENLYFIRESNNKGYMEFIPLTIAPIDLGLIELTLLNDDEKKWLNSYHELVLITLKPYINFNILSKICRFI